MTLAKRIPMIIVAAFMAAAITIVGCSNDETVSKQATVNNMPIGFNVVVDNNITTRSVASTTTSNLSEFDVWAFKADAGSDDSFVMGVDATHGYLFRKTSSIGIINDSIKALGVWGYASKYQVTFWPSDGTQKMSFYAVSPSSIYQTVPHRTLHITKATHAFDYEAFEAVNGSHSDQRDILISGSEINLTDINKIGVVGQPWMSVPLTFKHALSEVKFDAHLEPNCPKLEVIIKSISICNVARKATCTIGSDNTANWANYESTTQTYTVNTPGNDGNGIRLYTSDGIDGAVATPVALSTGTTAGANDDNLMLIPQTMTAWNPASTIDANDALTGANGTYLKIKCTIKQNNVNLLTEDYVYVPFAGNVTGSTDAWNGQWEPGRSYTYHMQFGLGRNSSGQLNGSDITFSVSIGSDWTTGSVTDPSL